MGSGDESIDFDLVARYLAGESEADERLAFERWLAAHPERADLIDGLRAVWAAGPELARRDGVDAEALAQRVVRAATNHRLARRAETELRLSHAGAPRRTAWVRILGAAPAVAAVALAAMTGTWVWRTAGAGRSGMAESRFSGRAFATARGERQTIRLTDGTRVVLGAASVLRLGAEYPRGVRDVYLEGEALFDVHHDAARRFAVHAANAIATDVGTSFDVRAYAGDGAVRVVVRDGSVDLRQAPAPLMQRAGQTPSLQAGDLAVVSDSAIVVTHGANVAALTAWAQGRLIFDRTPLRDVARDLARTFDVDIAVTDSTLLSRRITGAFSEDEGMDDVLTAIAVSVGARVERSGRHILIRGGVAGLIHVDSQTPPPMMRTAIATDAKPQ